MSANRAGVSAESPERELCGNEEISSIRRVLLPVKLSGDEPANWIPAGVHPTLVAGRE
jgi:hypothetical protein